MHVPFVDLHAQYKTIKKDIDAAIRGVIKDTAFIRGPRVRQFEEEFAAANGARHCVSCANGTDAIYIVLKMLGIGPGAEVITSASSWISTSETITQAGARPVFVDIDPDYFHLNTDLIEAKITPGTKAIIPVHLYGQPADMGRLCDLCARRGLHLIEDCAQAHLAEFEGRPVGRFGVASTFSFYPGKNLGAYGDAGCILTDDDDLAAQCRKYANHGSLKKHEHEIEGINSRLDGLQAAILSVKLPHLAGWNRRRADLAQRYSALLRDLPGVVTPRTRPGASHIFHVYCVRVPRRAELMAFLNRRGIETAIHYPTALPFLKAYEYLGHKAEEFPVAARFQDEILSLPMYPEMTDKQQDYVVAAVREFLGKIPE